MTENQKRRFEDRIQAKPLDWHDAQAEQSIPAGAANGGNTNDNEAARAAVQDELIERVRELLHGGRSAGLRLQIPDTDTYIIAGPARWIAGEAADLAGVRAEPVGHVVTWNKGVSGEVNSIEPIGKSGYSLAASLPEGTLIYTAAPTTPAQVPAAVSMLSGALNHAREALRFYASKSHFHMHQPDEWDTVSGEPRNFYEDSNSTATVEDGSVAKQTLEDIAMVECYASTASDDAQVPAAEVRAQALRDAANACEAEKVHVHKWHPSSEGDEAYNAGCDDCAAAIRSLAQSSTADKASEVRAASDTELLNLLDAWVERNKAAGYNHFVFAFDTSSTARDQIAADETLRAPSTADSGNTSALGEGDGDAAE